VRRRALLFGALALAGCADREAEERARVEAARARDAAARELLGRLEEPDAFAKVVELGAAGPVVEATAPGNPERTRRLACLALGRIGGETARDRLLELLAAPTPEPQKDGALRLYAAAGLTTLADPGTAVDLVLQLSTVNPNDNVAALAAEGQPGRDYYTVDAQICDALLTMGLWTAEDELVAQLRRHDYVRVLIDAHAALRRHTGIDLPFRYNGSYATRERDADAWSKRLKETRPARESARPFDASNERFRARMADLIGLLGGQSVNDRYIAEKALVRLGPPAVPFLVGALERGTPSAQREAALVLGRIGDAKAAPALRAALGLADGKARARAIEALRVIGDRGAAAAAAARLADDDPEVRGEAAGLLGDLGDASHADALRAALARETAPGTRARIVCALAVLGDEEVVEHVLKLFEKGEQLEREAARDALRRLDPAFDGDPLAPEEERAAAAERFRARRAEKRGK
jgi:HEAT repeat protein